MGDSGVKSTPGLIHERRIGHELPHQLHHHPAGYGRCSSRPRRRTDGHGSSPYGNFHPSAATLSTAGAGSECQSPGNVQIYDSPPPVNYEPYGGYGMALGVGQG